MPGKIHVQCYKCKTVYELEYDLKGQLVECAVCNSVFEVPQLGEQYKTGAAEANVDAENEEQAPAEANVDAENEEQAPAEGEDPNLKTTMGLESNFTESNTTKLSTKTIRLPRARCGMLPEVDDKFGAEQAHNPLHHQKDHAKGKELSKDFTKLQTKPAAKTPKTASKWWPWGKKKK